MDFSITLNASTSFTFSPSGDGVFASASAFESSSLVTAWQFSVRKDGDVTYSLSSADVSPAPISLVEIEYNSNTIAELFRR